MRLIGADGAQLDIVSYAKAKELAQAAGLDLVLVSDKAVPPVVRIMDYGKLVFEQKKNLKAQRKNSQAQKIKEIKFHVNIDTNDYRIKLKRGVDFLADGCRLKLTLMLRGREMAHKDLAYELMDRVLADLAEYGDADGKPKLLGRNITVGFAPRAAGKKKAVKAESAAEKAVQEDVEEVLSEAVES